jgi:deoxyribodipyrimidine photo-lyase
MESLYWITHDLRLDDNPALRLASQAEKLLLVYVIDPAWFVENQYGQISMGSHRWRFIRQTLVDLDHSLRNLGHRLIVVEGEPVKTISRLISQYQFRRFVSSQQFGSYEKDCLTRLRLAHSSVQFDIVDTYTLFDHGSLPMQVQNIPETYSKFRRLAEKATTFAPTSAPNSLPIMVKVNEPDTPMAGWSDLGESQSPFIGGESAATQHLEYYFSSDLPLTYKVVRNELDGWSNSSKMSAWLNSGCLSARRLLLHLNRYEQQRGHNDSTYWLYIELLWREYFQWLALKIGKILFAKDGNAPHPCTGNFDHECLVAWSEGTTAYPLVNACMRQLNATGYLSNRGRQIVASCLINELQGDWRYGAALFENLLVDYDVAVNWGNWQYMAGVGADPRGGRHFNLIKQTEIYDANGSYRERWLGC